MTGLRKLELRYLDWDTKQLGVRSGIIDITGSKSTLGEPGLSDAIKKICEEANGIRFITIKLPGSCQGTVNSLIGMGAYLIDAELVFSYPKESVSKEALPLKSGIDLRLFRRYSPRHFISLAAEMKMSRFFMDPMIPEGKAARLWRSSITNHCRGYADELLVAFYEKKPCGIIMLKFSGRKNVFLHVVGILKEFQGRGIAGAMLRETAQRYSASRRIYVETLSRNIPARKAYERAGFRQDSIKYVLHYWR